MNNDRQHTGKVIPKDPTLNKDEDDDEDETDDYEDGSIPWTNLIFLPFNPIFEAIVTTTVLLMSTLGPIMSVLPFLYCSTTMDRYFSLVVIKYYYKYCCTPLFIIDVILHVLHRQLTDVARRREYLPKSELCLLLDFIAWVPFYQMLVVTEIDLCPEIQFWPNIMAFTEILVVYRIVDYFSLFTTHSFINLVIGSTILTFVIVNCIACLHLLFTKIGYCKDCHDRIYDWRLSVAYKLNETDVQVTTYVYAVTFVISYVGHTLLDSLRGSTLAECFFTIFLVAFGYVIAIWFARPKLMCEAILHLRRISEFKPKVHRIIAEVQRRNDDSRAATVVESFYSLIWVKRNGITHIPNVFMQLPRYLRLDISLDLFWVVFYHSPTFRKTSTCFKRLLCDYIHLDYKLPGERFFIGPQAQTHLYYLKSGIVQIISVDDGTTPLLSMTSGTIFGDISFLVPPIARSVVVRCVTYCEVFYISRAGILNVLNKFPDDRRAVMGLVRERLQHAETLSRCKEKVRGLDRAEDENIYWIKKRWWELSNTIDAWKNNASAKGPTAYEFPPDEMPYHCAKYIGQLVLCTESQLHKKSMFAKFTFPWILLPNSLFNVFWHQIVKITVYLVLILYPPNISRDIPYPWFHFVRFRSDCVYCLDLAILLCTAMSEQEAGNKITFSDVLFARFKTLSFFLDVMATIWTEDLCKLMKKPQFYHIAMYNRLLKIKIFFTSEITPKFDCKTSTLLHLTMKIALLLFCYCYVGGFIFCLIEHNTSLLTSNYWMGNKVCPQNITNKAECNPDASDVMFITFSWLFNVLFTSFSPRTLMDIYFSIVINSMTNVFVLGCQCTLIAAMYLIHKDVVEYQFFVSNIKEYYKTYKIHPDLMTRLDGLLECHWKYFKGMDVMKPNILRYEPFDIYWHAHADIAVKIISSGGAFKYADSSMIRELAYKSKLLLRPKNTTIAVFGLPTKNISWLSQGWITCEYHERDGEMRKRFIGPGALLSPTSVFFGTASLQTYTTYTECETVFITRTDFTTVLRRYPVEWVNLQNTIKEYGDRFEKNKDLIMGQHADYESKLKERTFHVQMDIISEDNESEEEVNENKYELDYIFGLFFHDPESQFIRWWCLVRAITAFVLVINSSLLGVTGTTMAKVSDIVEGICMCFVAVDICIKFSIGYYTEKGTLVRDLKSCARRYATRTLFLDVLGLLQIHRILLNLEGGDASYEKLFLINTMTKLITQTYIVIGYMNYLADRPSSASVYIKLLKWQLILIMFRFTASQFFFSRCFNITRDVETSEILLKVRGNCWLPRHIQIDETPTMQQQFLVLAESFILSECGMLRLNLGLLNIDRVHVPEILVIAFLGIVFWYVTAYTITMLCLCKRTNATFRYAVTQLRQFLQVERVDRKVIDHVLAHYKYIWTRTDGINVEGLMHERIGVVFRRDLSYFFSSRTLHSLNTLLKVNESTLKRISGILSTEFFMDGEDIIRQNDLNELVLIVHRGQVGISIDNEQVAVLTKGSIFGLIDGTKARPSRILAYALEHTDIMYTSAINFQAEVDNTTLEYIKNAYPTSAQDYIAIRRPVDEDPRNTIPYLLRMKKLVQLPWMTEPADAQSSWYGKWLTLTWAISPVATACLVLLINTMPRQVKESTDHFLLFFDLLHVLFLIVEFFTLKVVIIEDKCVYTRFGFNIFKDPITYVSLFSLVAPLMTFVTGNWLWQCTRLVRLRLLYSFHKHFCKTFRTSLTPAIMKSLYVLLILHGATIGWMTVSCQSWDGDYKYQKPEYYTIPGTINQTIDYNEWTTPLNRQGYGCKRLTLPFTTKDSNDTYIYGYLVPKNWQWDYLIAFSYVMIIYTQTDYDLVVPFSASQALFNCLITLILYLVNLWVMSLAISYMYMNMRQLFNFDYSVQSLMIYLEHAGLSSPLLKSVMQYTSELWKRHNGTWLRGLSLDTPVCLREDIMTALYMHHLQGPPLLQRLPPYFLRQLVTRLQRIVIFPGKCVVRQNDIYPCIYFIHDGEVEKWHKDPKTGETRLISYLFTCGYFGLMPGLFPAVAHSYSYVTRTVTDFICLVYKDWQDLRDGYPEITKQFYEFATQVKNKERI